jgi:hypothetical protein
LIDSKSNILDRIAEIRNFPVRLTVYSE